MGSNIKILLFIFFVFISQIINAAPHSTVTLKNGSVINGDIVVQRVGNELTINAENATLMIALKDVVSKNTRKVKYENLSREMKRWALENRALKGDAYGRYAELVDLKTKKNTYTGLIRMPQDGNAVNTYLLVTPSTINVKWDEVQTIEKNTSRDIKYGLIDNVTTYSDKKYTGKIVSQTPGRSLTIRTDKGLVTLSSKDVKEIRKTKPAGADSYYSEIDFRNVIVSKDGKEKDGLVTMQHYGKKAKDNYITLTDDNGKSETIPLSAIAEIRTKYDDKDRPVYAPGCVYINEFRIDNATAQRTSDKVVFVDRKVFPFPEGISITFKSAGDKMSGKWSLVALSELPAADGRPSWGYETGKMADNTVQPTSRDRVSMMTQITYGYLSPGYYALVSDTGKEAYIFKITK